MQQIQEIESIFNHRHIDGDEVINCIDWYE